MSDLVYPYKPTIVIGKVNRAFSDCGLTSTNIIKIIKISTTGFQSFDPEDAASAIMGFEVGGAYLVQSKSLIDLTGLAYNTAPDDFTIVPGINVYANTWFAGIAIDTADFTTVGFDTTNLDIIYCIDDPYMSYNPNDGANAITGFVTGQAYLGYALADMDISSYLIPPVVITSDFEQDVEPFKYWGTKDTTTKGYWNVPVRFFADEASLPATGVENIVYVAKAESTSWYWDGAAYQQIGGGGGSYTDEQAQDAVGTILSSEFTYDDATPQISINQIAYSKLTGTPTIPTQYTDEMAQDATAAMIAAGTHTGITFTYDDAGNKIDAVVTGSGVNALAAIGSTPNANAASISGGTTLNLQPANSSFGGVVTTLTQTFAGVKTFQGSASSGSRQLSGITTGTGNGVFGQSQNGGYGGEFNTLHSSTNTMRAAVKVVRETSGAAAVGIGAAVSYHAESSDGNVYGLGMSGRVIYGLLGTSIQSAIRHTVYDKSVEIIAEETFASTVNTSDATPTNLITIPITDETAAVVEVTIVGKEVSTNGIVTGKKIFRYKKDGGTLSLGTQTSVLADEATGTIATATYAISSTSNNLSVDVTGVAAVTITWKVNVKIISN